MSTVLSDLPPTQWTLADVQPLARFSDRSHPLLSVAGHGDRSGRSGGRSP